MTLPQWQASYPLSPILTIPLQTLVYAEGSGPADNGVRTQEDGRK